MNKSTQTFSFYRFIFKHQQPIAPIVAINVLVLVMVLAHWASVLQVSRLIDSNNLLFLKKITSQFSATLPTPANQISSPTAISGGGIAGIVIALIIVILAVVGGILFFMWTRRRKQPPSMSLDTSVTIQRENTQFNNPFFGPTPQNDQPNPQPAGTHNTQTNQTRASHNNNTQDPQPSGSHSSQKQNSQPSSPASSVIKKPLQTSANNSTQSSNISSVSSSNISSQYTAIPKIPATKTFAPLTISLAEKNQFKMVPHNRVRASTRIDPLGSFFVEFNKIQMKDEIGKG